MCGVEAITSANVIRPRLLDPINKQIIQKVHITRETHTFLLCVLEYKKLANQPNVLQYNCQKIPGVKNLPMSDYC